VGCIHGNHTACVEQFESMPTFWTHTAQKSNVVMSERERDQKHFIIKQFIYFSLLSEKLTWRFTHSVPCFTTSIQFQTQIATFMTNLTEDLSIDKERGFWVKTQQSLLDVIILSWRHVSAPALGHFQVTKVYIRGNYTV